MANSIPSQVNFVVFKMVFPMSWRMQLMMFVMEFLGNLPRNPSSHYTAVEAASGSWKLGQLQRDSGPNGLSLISTALVLLRRILSVQLHFLKLIGQALYSDPQLKCCKNRLSPNPLFVSNVVNSAMITLKDAIGYPDKTVISLWAGLPLLAKQIAISKPVVPLLRLRKFP